MKTRSTKKLKALAAVLSVSVVALSPVVASAATDNANTTVSATVDGAISVSTLSTVAFTIVPTPAGSVSSNKDTVTVDSNVAAGYDLTVTDSDTAVTLTDGSNTFAATSHAPGAGGALANGEWGFAVAGQTGFDGSYTAENSAQGSVTKWAAMPASNGTPYNIKSTTGVATADATDVWYAAKADTSQVPAVYSGQVTYTVTTK